VILPFLFIFIAAGIGGRAFSPPYAEHRQPRVSLCFKPPSEILTPLPIRGRRSLIYGLFFLLEKTSVFLENNLETIYCFTSLPRQTTVEDLQVGVIWKNDIRWIMLPFFGYDFSLSRGSSLSRPAGKIPNLNINPASSISRWIFHLIY